jgi:hypothetical protein
MAKKKAEPVLPVAEPEGEEKFVQLGGLSLGLVKRSRIRFRRDNYRKMTPAQEETLRASIEKFGFQSLVVVTKEEDGLFGVVDGHHRLAELDRMGIAMIPVLILPENVTSVDADLGMLSFNVSAEIDDRAMMALLKDLSVKVDADELRRHATLSEGFMEGLLASFRDAPPVEVPEEPLSTGGQEAGTRTKKKDPQVKIVVLMKADDAGNKTIVDFVTMPRKAILSADFRNSLEDAGLFLDEVEAAHVETEEEFGEFLASQPAEESDGG